MNISDNDMKLLLKAQQGELDAVMMYNLLADTVKDKTDAETFRKLSAEEGRHAAVFKGMTGNVLKPKKALGIAVKTMYRLIGRKRLYPFIAKGEYDAAKTYAPLVKKFPEIESIMNDENRHGDTIRGLL